MKQGSEAYHKFVMEKHHPEQPQYHYSLFKKITRKKNSLLIITGHSFLIHCPSYHTFCFTASTFDLNFLLFLPVHPAANSGPREVSAVNECLVPRFDSKTKPGSSSLRIVACCWPSELWIWSSPSFLQSRDQLPTTRRVGLRWVRTGWLGVPLFTCVRARWSFSRNSPRFSNRGKYTKALSS